MKLSKMLKRWMLIHLINTLIGIALQLLFGWYFSVIPIGSISWFYAFILGCYSEAVIACWLYSLLFLVFSIFAYVKAFAQGEAIWFIIMCVIDIVAMSMLLIFIADSSSMVYWFGVSIQIVHAVVFILLHQYSKTVSVKTETGNSASS